MPSMQLYYSSTAQISFRPRLDYTMHLIVQFSTRSEHYDNVPLLIASLSDLDLVYALPCLYVGLGLSAFSVLSEHCKVVPLLLVWIFVQPPRQADTSSSFSIC